MDYQLSNENNSYVEKKSKKKKKKKNKVNCIPTENEEINQVQAAQAAQEDQEAQEAQEALKTEETSWAGESNTKFIDSPENTPMTKLKKKKKKKKNKVDYIPMESEDNPVNVDESRTEKLSETVDLNSLKHENTETPPTNNNKTSPTTSDEREFFNNLGLRRKKKLQKKIESNNDPYEYVDEETKVKRLPLTFSRAEQSNRPDCDPLNESQIVNKTNGDSSSQTTNGTSSFKAAEKVSQKSSSANKPKKSTKKKRVENEDQVKVTPKKSKKNLREFDWPLVHQLFPGLRAPSKQAQLDAIKEHQVTIKEGPFTKDEDKIIKHNFKRFFKEHSIEFNQENRAALLGFILSTDEEVRDAHTELRRLKNEANFKFELARGLDDRLIVAVYQRARKILHPFKRQANLTEEEKKQIIEQYKKTPFDKSKQVFARLAAQFNCDSSTIRRVISRAIDIDTKEEFVQGFWTPNETLDFIKALREVTEEQELSVIKPCTVDWVRISKMLKNRSAESCRAHFNNMPRKFFTLYDPDDSTKLINYHRKINQHKHKKSDISNEYITDQESTEEEVF